MYLFLNNDINFGFIEISVTDDSIYFTQYVRCN